MNPHSAVKSPQCGGDDRPLRAGVLTGLMWAGFHVVPYAQTGRDARWVGHQVAQLLGTRLLLVGVCSLGRNPLWPAVLAHTAFNYVWARSPGGGTAYNAQRVAVLSWVAGLVVAGVAERRARYARSGGLGR